MSRRSAASGSSGSASRSASGSASYFPTGRNAPTGPLASSDRRLSIQPARLPVSAARCNGLIPAHGRAGSTNQRICKHRRPRYGFRHAVVGRPRQLRTDRPNSTAHGPPCHVPMTATGASVRPADTGSASMVIKRLPRCGPNSTRPTRASRLSSARVTLDGPDSAHADSADWRTAWRTIRAPRSRVRDAVPPPLADCEDRGHDLRLCQELDRCSTM